MIVRQASYHDLEPLARLFDEYRQFYGASSDVILALKFLRTRFQHEQCVTFISCKDDVLTGFIQLYLGFSSVECAHYYILDDVYVSPHFRRQGAAIHLIDTAIQFARQQGAIRISVEAKKDNLEAKHLYHKLGFMEDDSYQQYHCFVQ